MERKQQPPIFSTYILDNDVVECVEQLHNENCLYGKQLKSFDNHVYSQTYKMCNAHRVHRKGKGVQFLP